MSKRKFCSQKAGNLRKLGLIFEDSGLFPVPVALFDVFALVAFLLTLGERELDFGETAAVEIKADRNQRIAIAPDRAEHLTQFLFLHQKFAVAARVVLKVRTCRIIRRNVGIIEPQLTLSFPGEGLA